jgi:hypothetical protein
MNAYGPFEIVATPSSAAPNRLCCAHSDMITDETEKWGKVVRAANIGAD